MMSEIEKQRVKERTEGKVSLDVEPDEGVKGNVIEYMYHYTHDGSRARGEDLNPMDASEWREVKKDIVACRKAAEKDELHDDIVEIEKVWHNVIKEHHFNAQGESYFQEEMWCGTASLFEWADYGGTGGDCDVPDCDNFVQEGQGVSTFEDWSNCCDECYESYRNGDWVPNYEQVRGF